MSSTPHILMVEDDTADCELILHELREGGLNFTFRRIEDEGELAVELARMPPDLVLCDHGGARFDSRAVLAAVRGLVPDLPFIIVTGRREAEAVGRALREGADGCVQKDRLAELAPAVRRTLRQHRRCRELEAECDRLRGELAAARGQPAGTGLVPICASCKSVRMAGNRWLTLEEFLGREAGFRLTHSLCPGCVEKFYVA